MQRDAYSPAERQHARFCAVANACMGRPDPDRLNTARSGGVGGGTWMVCDGPDFPEDVWRWVTRMSDLELCRKVIASGPEHLEARRPDVGLEAQAMLAEPDAEREYAAPHPLDPLVLTRTLICAPVAPPAAA